MTSNKANQKSAGLRLNSGERRLILMTGDFFSAVIAMALAIFIWARPDWLNLSLEFLQNRIPGWYYLLPVMWVLLMFELYDLKRASRHREIAKGIGLAAGVSLILYLLVYFTSDPKSMPRLGVAVFIGAVSILTFLWRLLYIRIFTERLFMRQTLIVGAGRAGSTLAKIVQEMKPRPFQLIGLIDDDPKKMNSMVCGFPVLGGSSQLSEIIQQFGITDIIFAISKDMNPELLQVLMNAEEKGVEVTTMPVVYEDLLGRVPIFLLEPEWLLRSFVDQAHVGGFYEMAKRAIDILAGIVGVIILVGLFPLISVVILLDSGLPIFYTQYRLGKNGRTFKTLKFRTMGRDAEKDGKARMAVENDARVTRVGKFLRRSHLDEFPQFINILRGEMSVVGPRAERPELVDELQHQVPFYRARLLVKPGLTGWAQVNFKYASNVSDTAVKLEHDLYYIKHRNLPLDISIILKTVGDVIGFKGL
jgi:exopolysaccharide biosynthesis polyprenyl glycosylphosphotransferase